MNRFTPHLDDILTCSLIAIVFALLTAAVYPGGADAPTTRTTIAQAAAVTMVR